MGYWGQTPISQRCEAPPPEGEPKARRIWALTPKTHFRKLSPARRTDAWIGLNLFKCESHLHHEANGDFLPCLFSVVPDFGPSILFGQRAQKRNLHAMSPRAMASSSWLSESVDACAGPDDKPSSM